MADPLSRFLRRWIWIGLIAAAFSTVGVALPPGSRVSGQGVEPAGQFLAWVHYSEDRQLTWLANTQDIWEVDRARQLALVYLSSSQAEALELAGYAPAIDLKRSQALQPATSHAPQSSGIPNFPCYRTVEETYQSIQDMVVQYPTLAQSVVFGQSWNKVNGSGGYDLIALKLTNQLKPGPKPVLLVMGGIHAREYTTAELATRFAETLLQRYGTDADVTWLLDETEIDVIPQANPDGRKIAESGILWRKNRDSAQSCGTGWFGVDLNRNFNFKWGAASQDPCAEDYQGPTNASEPETQALQAYIAGLFPARRGPADSDPAPADYAGLLISLHSYGQNVLFPWGWTYAPAPNQAQFNLLGQKFGFFNHYTVCQSNPCLYSTTGTTDEWAYATRGVPGFTFEMGTDFFQSCDQFAQPILPDNLQALIYAAKAARLPYQLPAGPDTLDPQAGGSDGATLSAVADDTRFAGAVSGAHLPSAIQASRYSLDTPTWEGGGSIPMAAADGAFDQPVEPVTARIDLAGLNAGRHTVYVESADSAGHWGVAGAAFLDAEYSLQAAPELLQFCKASSTRVALATSAARNYSAPIDMSLLGLPAGLTGMFDQSSLAPGGSTGLNLTADASTAPGVYPVSIEGMSGLIRRSLTLQIGVAEGLPGQVAAVGPVGGAEVSNRRPEFTWQAGAAPATYEVQIARDSGFKIILVDQNGLVNADFISPVDLPAGQPIYWRVRANNPCGAGDFSTPAAFTVPAQVWFPFLARN